MNIVKTKLRNRMDPKLVNSILTITAGIGREQLCSLQYSLPPEVLNLISKSYLTPTPENLHQNNEEGQEFLDLDSPILF